MIASDGWRASSVSQTRGVDLVERRMPWLGHLSLRGGAPLLRSRRRKRGLDFRDPRHLAELEHLLSGGRREQVHAPRDDAGPSGLMARSQTGSVVAMEVLVEQDVIAPVWICAPSVQKPSIRSSLRSSRPGTVHGATEEDADVER